ncbi:hypothetical protein D3C75_821050 [compost metagenome]
MDRTYRTSIASGGRSKCESNRSKKAQKELEKRLKQEKNRRMYERYQTIYLHAVKQMPVNEIAEVIRRNPVTVNTYIKSYLEKGLDGLVLGVSTGAPEQLTVEQQQQLKQTIIMKLPHEVGFPAKHNWTLALAAGYVKREFERSYTIAGFFIGWICGLPNRRIPWKQQMKLNKRSLSVNDYLS